MIVSPHHSSASGSYYGLTINAAKRFMTTQFRDAGLDTPDLDARVLIMAATGLTHTELITCSADSLSTHTSPDKITDYTARRLAGEPVDHILGYREFYGRRFNISKDVLSPRPETEMLVDTALEILKAKPKARILDLGTGSGAIVISILAEMEHVQGVAVDVSKSALDIAAENAAAHNIGARLTLLEGSWFAPVADRFDIILSNPPYITATAMEDLNIEVKSFDPELALQGGEDGLIAYRAIIAEAAEYLHPGGILLFEIGFDQGKSVSDLLTKADFAEISVHKDLAGHDRMIKAAYKA